MRDFDYIICGNNAGAMIAALTLAKRHQVAVVNPSPNWGGIFAGIKIDGKQFDIGMAFMEFGSFYPQSDDLASYNPASRNDSARFLHLIKDFFAPRMNFTEVENLKTMWNGAFYEDIIMANRLQMLSSLSAAVKEKIIFELKEIVTKKRLPLHAAHKKSHEKLFLTTNYRDASLANHGDTLHNLLIAPFCRKVLNISAQKTLALFHRVAWCPLYYPETLLAALQGEKPAMPDTHFHYPQGGYFAKSVEMLAAEMRSNDRITLVQDKPLGVCATPSPTLSFAAGTIRAKKIIWSNELQQLYALTGEAAASFHPEKSSMTLVFAEVDRKAVAQDFSTVFVCGDNECVYRVTNQNAAHPELPKNKFIFEMNTALLRENNIDSDDEIIAHSQKFAERAAIFNAKINERQYAVRHFKNALTLPTAENFQKFDELQKKVELRLPNIDYIGAAAGFAAGSFNDQAVAALQLGKKYGIN